MSGNIILGVLYVKALSDIVGDYTRPLCDIPGCSTSVSKSQHEKCDNQKIKCPVCPKHLGQMHEHMNILEYSREEAFRYIKNLTGRCWHSDSLFNGARSNWDVLLL